MRIHHLTVLVSVTVALQFCIELQAAPNPIQAVSVADPGLARPVSAGGDSLGSIISPDGSFVVFMSDADNLVSNDHNGLVIDIFLRNRTNGVTRLVSVNVGGTGGGNGHSLVSSFTPDGRFIVFESTASDLVSNDTNRVSDVFVYDRVDGKTVLVSANVAGQSGNGASSDAVITPAGRYVAFVSTARDLADDDTNGIPDVFVRDLQTGTTTLVSVGAQAPVNSGFSSDSPVISSDGHFVAFTSTASNLVAGLGQPTCEVYVRDLQTGVTRLGSTNVAAVLPPPGPGWPRSYSPLLSEDGRWLVFKAVGGTAPPACLILRRDLQTDALEVVATNVDFVASDTPDSSGPVMTPDGRFIAYTASGTTAAARNVFRWDGQTRTAVPVSVDLSGVLSTNGMSDAPALSADGRFVTFVSSATVLLTNPVNGEFQVYVRDLESGTTQLVTADPAGEGSGDAFASLPTISDDGRFVAFDSCSDVFVAEDHNNAFDVFVRDTVTDTTELVSTAELGSGGFTANGNSNVGANCVSADGRWVVFTSLADDLAAGDTNGLQDVYVRDLQEGTNALVSVGMGGASANGPSSSPVLSATGLAVAFVSTATNLVSGDANGVQDVFVRDLVTGTTGLVSVNADGTGSANGLSQAPSLSADGRRVAFQSLASNVTTNDIETSVDVFVRDLDSGTTTLASLPLPDVPGARFFSAPLLSPDGRFVAFSYSTPAGLAVKDLQAGTYTNLPGSSLGAAAISGNSRWLVFAVRDAGGGLALMFHDLNRATNRAAVLSPTVLGSVVKAPLSVSQDGRFVAFSGNQPVVPGDTNLTYDVFLYDAGTDQLTLVSRNRDGTGSGNGRSESPSLSAAGRFLAFQSEASDLVADDSNGYADVFLHDRLIGQTTLVTASRSGPGTANHRSSGPTLNAAGTLVVFRSAASDLAPGDFNERVDAFAYAVTPPAAEVDTDQDGLEDGWERWFFGDLSRDGQADFDGDGVSDRDEFRAGTQPTDRNSVLACDALVAGDGRTEVSWDAAPGRVYRVQFKDDLDAPAWTDLAATVSILGSRARIADATAGGVSQRFYRVALGE